MVRANHLDVIELFFVRLLVVIYFSLAHFAKYTFWFSGLRIQYINHKPWPYRKMWREFYSGDFNE